MSLLEIRSACARDSTVNFRLGTVFPTRGTFPILVLGNVHSNGTAFQLNPVHGPQSILCICRLDESDEAEALRAACLTVEDDLGFTNITELGKGLTEAVVGNSPRQTTHKQLAQLELLKVPSETKR